MADLLHVQPITGAHAQEDLVKCAMPTTRIMHFATHGLLIQAPALTFSFVSGSISIDLPPGAVVHGPVNGLSNKTRGLPSRRVPFTDRQWISFGKDHSTEA